MASRHSTLKSFIFLNKLHRSQFNHITMNHDTQFSTMVLYAHFAFAFAYSKIIIMKLCCSMAGAGSMAHGIWDARQYPTDIVQIVCINGAIYIDFAIPKKFFKCFFCLFFFPFKRNGKKKINAIWRIKPQPTLIILKTFCKWTEQSKKKYIDKIVWKTFRNELNERN